MQEPHFLRKTYSSSFLLDRAKLSRLVSIMEQGLQDSSTAPNDFPRVKYFVTHRDGKTLVLHSETDVLGLDNTVKNPIVAIELSLADGNRDGWEVHAWFDSDRSANISIAVQGSDARRVNDLFSQMEEQVERTRMRSVVHFLKQEPWWFLAAPLFAFPIALALVRPGKSSETVLSALSSAATDSARLAALVAAKLYELDSSRSSISWTVFQQLFTVRNMVLLVPSIIVLMSVVYSLSQHYPRVVFYWGDNEQHYGDLLSGRRFVGGVILASLLMGVFGNLLAARLTSAIP